jgi:hypothetical protein
MMAERNVDDGAIGVNTGVKTYAYPRSTACVFAHSVPDLVEETIVAAVGSGLCTSTFR